MQQAEMADSTRTAFPSAGKYQNISGRKIVLEIAEIDEICTLDIEAMGHLRKLDTLLTVLQEATDESSAAQGLYYRPSEWPVKRFAHLLSLVELAQDEVRRLERLMAITQ